MPSILIIDKSGIIKAQNIKDYNESDLYKKAGFKSNDGFKLHTVWKVEIKSTQYSVHVFGKISGRAGQENKYDFPPPIDKILFFGSTILVNKNAEGAVSDLTLKEWEAIYEDLFGGFEDIGDDDDDDEEEDDEEDEDIPRTKEGYAKDGFIVDDDDEEEDDEEEDEDEEEEEEDDDDDEDDVPRKKSSTKKKPTKNIKLAAPPKKSTSKKSTKAPQNVFINLSSLVEVANQSKEAIFMDCTGELSEEEYL